MNIVDILIILLILSYVLRGFKNGAIKEGVSFIGSIAVLVLAYFLKNPISVYMYQNFPFFNMSGILSGISVLNILVYEILAFCIVAIVLLVIYNVILAATNIVETLLKVTVVLEIPSKILGLFVGAVEGITITFLLLFITLQFDLTRQYIDKSTFGNFILTKTPVLSSATDSAYKSINEIYSIAEEYKESKYKDEANEKALDVLLKHKVIEPHNAKMLLDTGKLDFTGAADVVNKYYTTN